VTGAEGEEFVSGRFGPIVRTGDGRILLGGKPTPFPLGAHGVAATDTFACAIVDAKVQCWGFTATPAPAVPSHELRPAQLATPATLVGPEDVVSLRAVEGTLCALSRDGRAWCLYDDSPVSVALPLVRPKAIRALGLGFFAKPRITEWPGQLVLGREHVSGGIVCFGYADHSVECTLGAKPFGTLDSIQGKPVDAFAMGLMHACALIEHAVVCWGENSVGQLGRGSAGEADFVPAPVAIPEPVVDLVAGPAHTCARTVAGNVWCWGRNVDSEIGTGAPSPMEPRPVRVQHLDGRGPR
jgi:hypothetical protein